jgi:protein TonB
MFEDSLLESGGKGSMLYRRGPWATVTSFAIESALVGVLMLIPFLSTEVLPRQRLTDYLVTPTPPPASAPRVETQAIRQNAHQSEIDNGRLKLPGTIPKNIAMIKDVTGPESGSNEIGIANSTGIPGVPWNGSHLVDNIASSGIHIVPAAAALRRVQVSGGVTAGLLVHRVQPSYPALARQARISGEVLLQAVIGKDGTIENLRVISGHPMLVQSAIEAVRQWRYKPYYLNNQPVEVDTQVTVNFTLAGS